MKRALRIMESLAINVFGIALVTGTMYEFFMSLVPKLEHSVSGLLGFWGIFVVFGLMFIVSLTQVFIAIFFARLAYKLTGELQGFIGFYGKMIKLCLKLPVFKNIFNTLIFVIKYFHTVLRGSCRD